MKFGPLLPLFFVVFLTAALPAQTIEEYAVFFDTDSDILTEESQQELVTVIRRSRELGNYKLGLKAHTDARGASAYNMQLAQRRAEAVQEFLAMEGVKATSLSVENYGESQPAFSNNTEEGMQGNRRVDIILTTAGPASLAQLFDSWEEESRQRFSIDAGSNTKVEGREGTRLYIPAGSFTDKNGKAVTGEVQLHLREAYAMEDMLMAGLTTTAGHDLLISGGMVKVEATANGQPLQLREGARLTLSMPAGQLEEGMELFRGQPDGQGGVADWQPAGQPYQSLDDILGMPPSPKAPAFIFVLPEYSIDKSGEPKKPEAPLPPHRPHRPEREQFRYNPPFTTRILMGKAEIEAKEEADHQEAFLQYEERMAQYQLDSTAYTSLMARYKKELAEYWNANAAWKDKVDKQILFVETGAFASAERRRQRAEFEKEQEKWRAEMEQWKAERQRRLVAFEKDYGARGELNTRIVNQYFYEINELGWINCDRFWQVPADQKVELAIQGNGPGEEQVFVAFENTRSILRASPRDAWYLTQAVPKGEPVKIIGLKVEQGRPQLAVHRATVGDEPSYNLAYEVVSLPELKQALRQL